MVNISSVPNFWVSKEEHLERQRFHLAAGRALRKNIQAFDFNSLENFPQCTQIPDLIVSFSNPKWANRQFGAVNTVQKAGCLPFVAKLFLDELYHDNIDFDSILNEVVTKNYRLWKLAKRKKTLSMASPTVEDLKKAFPDDKEIQSCDTLEEIYSVAGKPVGIGGSMFFMDNLIISNCRIFDIVLDTYQDTRFHNVEDILSSLENGCSVPVRVNNSVYLNDASAKGGHYITLYRIEDGMAIVMDSCIDENYNSGIRKLPVKQLFDAMIADPDKICAWDTSCIQLTNCIIKDNKKIISKL